MKQPKGVIIHRGYRFRLKATESDAAAFRRSAGSCRFVWNELVVANERRREVGEPVMSYGAMCKCLTQLKAQHTFLREPYANSLQQTLRDLSIAYWRMRNPNVSAERPRLKKRQNHVGIRFPAGFRIDGRALYLPKLGWIGFRKSREIPGRVKAVTVRFDGVHWYVSMQVEQEIPEPTHASVTALGIDVGVERFAALSDGSYIDGPNALKKNLGKIRCLQQRMTRKQKYSNNWRKAQRRLSRLYRRIADVRSDATHKASTTISKSHAVVVLERLRIANMSASASGTVQNPGKNVSAKRALNRRILDQGWGQFCGRLQYKLALRGGRAIFVDARGTSRTCAKCNYANAENRKTQARFQCVRCGHVANADTNAAINILRRAGLSPDSLWRPAVTPVDEAGSSTRAPSASGHSLDE